MAPASRSHSAPCFLGIEGGATSSRAILADAQGRPIAQATGGPGNLKLLSQPRLLALLRTFRDVFPRPSAVAVGLAGARTNADFERIRQAARRIWPGCPCHATNDLETALVAAEPSSSPHRRARQDESRPRVLVLSGTGSCCFGVRPERPSVRVGGWGHLLGDRGSAYDLGLSALRAVVQRWDMNHTWPTLGADLLRDLSLTGPEQLVDWISTASKDEVAALAIPVFAAAGRGDRLARELTKAAAHQLARQAIACARRLVSLGGPVRFVLTGGVLQRQLRFARRVAKILRTDWPGATVDRLPRDGVWGAVELARRLHDGLSMNRSVGMSASRRDGVLASRPGSGSQGASEIRWSERSPIGAAALVAPDSGGRPDEDTATGSDPSVPNLESLAMSPTEQRNPRSMNLDRLPLGQAIELMLREDARIPSALLEERPVLERAVRLIVGAFRQKGRLFYVGAGTSGRLGVLDASECPPTFSVGPDQVQGIIAGGARALWRSIEGAEDDAAAGARAMRFRGVTARDVVMGIAASGRTPFVWGALHEARSRGAKTILLCFDPRLRIPSRQRPTLVIAPDVGPEVLTGSTRLKAGTATKMILNILTTLAMVRLGKVLSNLMVDLDPSNLKLRDRAVRIVGDLTGAEPSKAQAALGASQWNVKRAVARLQGVTRRLHVGRGRSET